MSNKNKSRWIKDGCIGQTSDKSFHGAKDYKGKPTDKPFNRPFVVVATNKKDEMAVVKITHSPKGKRLKHGLRGHDSRIRPYVFTQDEDCKPIKPGTKFKLRKERLSKDDLRKVQRSSFRGNRNQAVKNRNQVRKMKGRKPKWPRGKPPKKRT